VATEEDENDDGVDKDEDNFVEVFGEIVDEETNEVGYGVGFV